jgi:hypothetical protein
VSSGQNIQIYNDIVPEINPNLPGIAIVAKFDQDPGYGAETKRGTLNDIYEITSGGIALYAGWYNANDYLKSVVIAHEIGHTLLATAPGYPHTNDRSLMDADLGSQMLHSYQQLAIRIMYNKNPGDSI